MKKEDQWNMSDDAGGLIAGGQLTTEHSVLIFMNGASYD